MKRLSILLSAATLVAIVAPVGVVQAGCLPVPSDYGQIPCQYLGIPQTQCRSALYQVNQSVLNNPAVPAAVRNLVNGAGLCEKVPTGAQATGQDAQVFHLGNSLVEPDTFNVGTQRSIFVHNLDQKQHSFTDPGCLDALTTTPCRFNKVLQIGDFGLFAEALVVGSSTFAVGKSYSFTCRYHPGEETGTFTVTD